MGEGEALRAVHREAEPLGLQGGQDGVQGGGQGVGHRAVPLFQGDEAGLQPGGLHQGLEEEVQLVQLPLGGLEELPLLRPGHRPGQEGVVEHPQVGHRGADLVGDVGDQGFQAGLLPLHRLAVGLHGVVEPLQPVVEPGGEGLRRRCRGRAGGPVQHTVQGAAQLVGEIGHLPGHAPEEGQGPPQQGQGQQPPEEGQPGLPRPRRQKEDEGQGGEAGPGGKPADQSGHGQGGHRASPPTHW